VEGGAAIADALDADRTVNAFPVLAPPAAAGEAGDFVGVISRLRWGRWRGHLGGRGGGAAVVMGQLGRCPLFGACSGAVATRGGGNCTGLLVCPSNA
jgi:hypothetical protein